MPIKRVLLITFVVVGLLSVFYSCKKSTTPDLRNLTDTERIKAIHIALETPEAKEHTKLGLTYRVELSWVAITWEDSRAVDICVLDYDIWEVGVPTDVPHLAVIYPNVTLYFGETGQFFVSVAVDLEAEKAVFVGRGSFKESPFR